MEAVAKAPTKRLTVVEKLDKFDLYLNNFLATMAGISLFSMMFLIVGNSIIRKFYVPFIGTVEVVGWLAALTTAFAVGHTQRHKGHVVLDILMEKCPLKLQAVVSIIVNLINIVFFTVVFYCLFLYSLNIKESDLVSESLAIAYYPFVTMLSIGFFGLLFALVVDLIKDLKKGDSE